jgi:hypothetical protein
MYVTRTVKRRAKQQIGNIQYEGKREMDRLGIFELLFMA